VGGIRFGMDSETLDFATVSEPDAAYILYGLGSFAKYISRVSKKEQPYKYGAPIFPAGLTALVPHLETLGF